jgi:hypothetical protein
MKYIENLTETDIILETGETIGGNHKMIVLNEEILKSPEIEMLRSQGKIKIVEATIEGDR